MKITEILMWRLIIKRFPLIAVGVLCGAHLAVAASAQPIPIEPENRAKLSRQKAEPLHGRTLPKKENPVKTMTTNAASKLETSIRVGAACVARRVK